LISLWSVLRAFRKPDRLQVDVEGVRAQRRARRLPLRRRASARGIEGHHTAWVVSLPPAQVAAVRALDDPGYYAARYAETAELREELVGSVTNAGSGDHPWYCEFHSGPFASAGRTRTIVKRCANPLGSCVSRAMGQNEIRIQG